MQRDLHVPASEAVEERRAPDMLEETVEWKKRARAFVESLAGGDGGLARRGKRYRIKTYRWLCSTDASLKACTGVGWSYFMQAPDTDVPHMLWPTISFACDQGPDGNCALNWLLHKRVGVMKVFDASHRITNDCDLALKDAGFLAVNENVQSVFSRFRREKDWTVFLAFRSPIHPQKS